MLGAVVVGTVGVVLASCSSNNNNGTSSGGGTGQISCDQAAPVQKAGVQSVPVSVSKAPGGNVVTVQMCVGKSGPYAFVVDTGTSQSIIDSTLSSTLKLADAGSTALGGSGCATSGSLMKVASLRMGNVAMAGQAMVRAPLTDWGGTSVDGVLGSDILERFGAVKLDLRRDTLTLAGTEGPAVTLHALVTGRPGLTPPKNLLSSPPAVNVPLTIVDAPGSVGVFAQTTVAGQNKTYPFVLATGSPTSAIAPVTGLTAGLAQKGKGPIPAGVGCHGTVNRLAPGSVTIADAPPVTVSFHAVPINGAARSGINGWLGLDYLGRHPITLVNYVQGTLVQADR